VQAVTIYQIFRNKNTRTSFICDRANKQNPNGLIVCPIRAGVTQREFCANVSPTREETNVEQKRWRSVVFGGAPTYCGDTCDVTVVQSSMSNQHNYSPGGSQ
jgi:hypothetical protein